MSELWDAYDKDFKRIDGVTLMRGEPIPEGMRHLVCEIIVRHADGALLLMRRDLRKPFGGMWEATAGGSALAGEAPLEAAKRELFEETGVRASSLTEIGTVISDDTIYVEYLCVTDCDKSGVTLQQGETVDFKWVSREELLLMAPSELLTRRVLRFVPGLTEKDRYLTSPCMASSLPYWKSVSFTVPENMRVMRDDEYDPKDLRGFSDEPYFKLIHNLEDLEKPSLPKDFSLVSPDIEAISSHIRACYGGGPSAEELTGYKARPVYDPSLWLAVADKDGALAATGIAELDPDIGEGILEWIQVSEDRRRRGLGEYLVRELLWRMRGRADFVTVSGKLNNPTEPLSLYTRCGFGKMVVWHVLTIEDTLSIRRMTQDDLMPLCELLSDERVMEHIEPVFDFEKTKSFLEKAGRCEPHLIWTVELNGAFIGYVIYHDYDEESREIGWLLLPAYWGRGIATRLTRKLTQTAFGEGKNAVIECSPEQAATKHIAMKCGFTYKGVRDGIEIFELRAARK